MCTENLSRQEEKCAWPICPSFLVKSIFSKNEKYSLNKHGVYASDTVRGLLADASDDKDIQNPLSLFQVVPESCKFEDFAYIGRIKPASDESYLNNILQGKQVIRIDPNFLFKNKTCCDRFRSCNGYENKCHEQDCRIALLYHKKLNKIHYTNNFEDYYKELSRIIDEYNREFAEKYPLHCERDEHNNRLYVWYQCPYSNLLEYFFPIIHSGKVIAVLMQGQRIPENFKKKDIFQGILNDSSINPQKIADLRLSIDEIPESEFHESAMSEKRLKAIQKRIQTLEKRVDEEVMAHTRAYVSNNFHRIGLDFHQQIKDEIKRNNELKDEAYKGIVNGALRKICYVFNKDGFIRIYSTESEFEEEKSNTDTFYLIGTSSKLTESGWEKIELHDLPLDVETLENMNNEDFSPHLKQQIQFHDGVIFRIESLSIGNTKHLVWKEYPKKEDINQKQFDEFSHFLKTFYHTLWEPYNLLRSVRLRKKLGTSMRVSVHETSQIIPIIVNTLKKEFNMNTLDLIREDGLNMFGITQRMHTLHDTIQRLQLLDNLYKRSTLMFKELKPKLEWTDLHRLIYSIRSMCDEKAKADNMQKIFVNAIDGFKFNQYKIYTDYQLVSHALFNLVDNAIKYGYMGSIININISLLGADLQHERNGDLNLIKAIQISIVSYGSGVNKKEEQHIYELFYRSQASKVKDGMGIGLFLVKKICNSLGYTIEYKGNKLSEYNLPIYYHGIRQGIVRSLKTASQVIIEEAVNNELSDKDWYIEDLEFDTAINQPTYRNEFILTFKQINNKLIQRN